MPVSDGRWGFHMKYQRGKCWPSFSLHSTTEQRCDLGSDFLPLSLNFLITNMQTLTPTSWGCQVTSPSLGPTDVSIGSSDMHYDHTVAKTPEERREQLVSPPFPGRGGPGAEQAKQQEGHSPDLFQHLLGLGFLPGFGRERRDPKSEALSIGLAH